MSRTFHEKAVVLLADTYFWGFLASISMVISFWWKMSIKTSSFIKLPVILTHYDNTFLEWVRGRKKFHLFYKKKEWKCHPCTWLPVKLFSVFPKRWYSFTSQIILPCLIKNKIRQSTLPGKEESNYTFREIK